MTAPSHCVLEGDPTNGIAPRRPDALCEDMGGLQFQDDPNDPPRPNEHMSAKDFKQVEMLVQRLAKMMPTLSIDLHVSTGMGTVNPSAVACGHSTVTTSSITAAPTGTTGEYTITLPANVLPVSNRRPVAKLGSADNYANSGDAADVTVYSYTETSIVIRVRDFTGALTGVGATVRVDVF